MRYAYVIHVKKNNDVVLDSIWTNEGAARKRYDELIEEDINNLVSFVKLDPNTPDLKYVPKIYHKMVQENDGSSGVWDFRKRVQETLAATEREWR